MKRFKHDMSSGHLWTAEIGRLYPVNLMEILPSDRWMLQTKNFTRFTPLVSPAMVNLKNYIHHWYVPTWLLWDDFEDFITGKTQELTPPKIYPITWNFTDPGTLWDYIGLPTCESSNDFEEFQKQGYNFMALKAFWFIYCEFYRDEDLDEWDTETIFNYLDDWTLWHPDDGNVVPRNTKAHYDDWNDFVSKMRILVQRPPLICWKKDNFTIARPWKMKGGDVTIPLDISANGAFTLEATGSGGQKSARVLSQNAGVNLGYDNVKSGNDFLEGAGFTPESNYPLTYKSGLAGAGVSVTDLSLASNLARLRYRDGRMGSRYSELIQRFGANASDARLFLPQYLGGGSSEVRVNEVVQTSESTDTSSLGDMGGHAVNNNISNVVRRIFNEHGYVITMSFFRPSNYYMNATDRHWFYDMREDYFFKELENIGVQEIYKKEITPCTTHAKGNEVFGYTDAYYYYRQKHSKVSGLFKTELAHWHLARNFNEAKRFPSDIVLNLEFVKCRASNRIFADNRIGPNQILVQSHNIAKGYRVVGRKSRLSL